MLRLRLTAPIALLALTLAACGGSKVTVEEVPGDPVQLTVPGTGAALKPQATATATASATPTATTTGSTGTSSGTTQSTTPSTPSSGTGTGTTAGGTPAPSTDSSTNDQPPPAGSDAQQFEAFCAQNPGAC